MKRFTLSGRAFVPVGESTVAHDFRFLELVQKAELNTFSMEEGEAAEDFAKRLMDRLMATGKALDLLACLIVPEPPEGTAPGETWTPELAAETAGWIGALQDPKDKALIHALLAETLVDFFESGLVSLTSSRRSSPGPGETDARSPDGTAAGQGSLPSSQTGTSSAPSGSSDGPSVKH